MKNYFNKVTLIHFILNKIFCMIYWLVYLQNSTSKCSLASTAPWKLSLVRTKTPSSTVMSSSAKATAVSTRKLKINIFILESGRIKWQLKMKWCLLPASTWQRAENSHACAFIRNSDAWSTAIGLPWPFDLSWKASTVCLKKINLWHESQIYISLLCLTRQELIGL